VARQIEHRPLGRRLEGSPVSALSDFLTERKDERDLSIRAIADRAGISPTTVQKILNGATRSPDAESLRKIGDVLGVSLDRLLELAGVEPGPEPFILPSHADMLTERERRVVRAVVRQILESAGRIKPRDDQDTPQDGAVVPLRPDSADRERPRVLRAAHRQELSTGSDED
jgi:transcriptional regulator with XRE-family HTH domain